jgi:hypothetical protein
MDANDILFRCSSLGHLMTESRSKSDPISETTKTHLVDVFVSKKYQRKTDISNRYTNKGLMVEEDSLTLYSRHKKRFFKKNVARLQNEFIIGTPDIITEPAVIDIKSSWDIFTFFRNNNPDKLNKTYYWQLQGYMALTGIKNALLVYCLVNTPDILIGDEKRKLSYKMGVIDGDNDKTFIQACAELDRLMIYDDIPMEERVYEIFIERDDAAIERLYSRIKDCRKYMNENLFKIEQLQVF